MSNKTFKSTVSNRTIQIDRSFHGDICFLTSNMNSRDFIVDKKHAPALALAILEAAGIVPTAHESYASADHDRTLEDAAWEIRRVVNAKARESEVAAKEAADREALEAEARILFDAGTDHLTKATLNRRKPLRWDEVSDAVRAAHVAVARKARELHKAVS